MILHLLEDAAPPSAVPGEIVRTILFVDLSSFTPLTEAMGDAAAAGIVERFSDMVRDAAAACEPRFPALRIGAQSGSVLYGEGDYVGANVNLAARVTSAAQRNQFLVTGAVREVVEQDGIEFDSVGSRSLKGISEAVDLYEVRTGEERKPRTP